MLVNNNNQTYKAIYFLATLSMCLMLVSAILGNKLIDTSFGVLSAASLVSPFWFVLSDIITEVYGFKINMRVFWGVIICNLISVLTISYLIGLKSPGFWHG